METKFIYKHIQFIYNFIVLIIMLSLTTSCLTEEEQLEIKFKPVSIETTNPSSISYNSVVIGGSISAPQERNVYRGVCWGTSQYPSLDDDKVTDGGFGIGIYSVKIIGLKANTTYYIRAFASSKLSTVYGNQVSIKTAMPTNATIFTNSITTITTTTAICGGNITSDGGITVSESGICWNTSPNPTTTNSKAKNSATTGNYTNQLTGLLSGTIYYVRAYASNSLGTTYGNEVSFRTLSSIPELSTISATSISATGAICGGSITHDGGATISARGVCWSTSSSPTILNSKTNDGTGSGSFSSMLIGLLSNSTYYVRAYATNSLGTAYGSVISFKTSTVTIPTLSTISATTISTSSALSGGNITNDGGSTITSRGVCWSNSTTSPTTSYSKTIDGSGDGSFTSSITDLTPGTTYYVRAYATNSAGTAYGSVINFKTFSIALPTLSTNSITSITTTSATGGGNITSDGGGSVTSRGVCWSSSTSSPTINNSTSSNGSGTGSYSISITGLSANTTYYVRSYATNSAGTAYGGVVNFSTNAVSLPSISTNSISSITTSTALGGGNITSDGGASISSKGICWSTSSNPTTSNSKTIDGSGIGAFSSFITGLSPNTYYYVRAYATNSAGTSYGTQTGFYTLNVSLPSVSTTSVSSISITSAYSGGSITSDGGATISAKGVCWSTSSFPTTSNSKTFDGTGVASFSSSMTGLSPYTYYYVRAYATNSAGTSYGTQIGFYTLNASLPSISTTSVSSISITSAYSGGSITSDGGATISAKGVCWSTSSSPTIYDNKTSNGTGTSAFSSSISGLLPNTTYYLRAYATNIIGTAYGSQVTFKTTALTIGLSYQGGLIFYIDGTGAHGLVCASSDQSNALRWYNGSYITTGATTSYVGYGNSNTNTIVSYQGTGSYAARLCYDLTLNGYSDWFLPSRSELSYMYTNLKSAGLGGFSSSYYWSSTESTYSSSYYYSFYSGSYGTSSKSSTYYVRAVRAF